MTDPEPQHRPRVLLVAEECSPELTSVPLVGWSHARALLDVVDGHLVTQIRNRAALERAGLVPGRDFTAIDTEAVAKPLHRLRNALRGGKGVGWTTNTAIKAIAYYAFERDLWRQFGPRIANGEFEIVHRITPLSPTSASTIAPKVARAGAKFVLGPLNGGVPWPKAFDNVRRSEREWLSYVRGAYRLMPGYGSTRKHAAAILAGSRDTYAQLPANAHDRTVYIPENAVALDRFAFVADKPAHPPLRVAFLGRLVPYKGADMLLEALVPLLRDGSVELDVLGDGPQLDRLQTMVREADLASTVRLHGWVPHETIQERLRDCHVFGFPSIREFGGGVVLEAMAMGLVPVVVDYAGPAELVTASTGIAVPLGTRGQIVAALRAVFSKLAGDPTSLAGFRDAGRARVERLFTWPAKAKQTLEVYRWILDMRPDKPDFGMPFP